MARRAAIAVPAHDEAGSIGGCVESLMALAPDARVGELRIFILANNCSDRTASAAAEAGRDGPYAIEIREVRLETAKANAGWARRLALEAGADWLVDDDDVLLSTDADTLVARDWLQRTLDHLDAGFSAVAGLARLNPRELRRLEPAHRRRLAEIRRYQAAFDGLRAAQDPCEASPRHSYEGGASMAMTLGAYRRAGGAPTPAVGEDKAMFEAIRRSGGAVRHAMDVRVLTSARLSGRAPGGASDTLALWGRQGENEPIWGLSPLGVALGKPRSAGPLLTFACLAGETARPRELVRALRAREPLALAS